MTTDNQKSKTETIKKRYLSPFKNATKTFVGSLHHDAEIDRAEKKVVIQEKAKEVNKNYVNPFKKAVGTFAENVTTPYEDDTPVPENLVDTLLKRPIFWIWLVVFFITLIIYMFIGSTPYYGFDLLFSQWVQSTLVAPLFETIAKLFSFTFDTIEFIVIVIALTLCFLISKSNKKMAPIFVGGCALWALAALFKKFVDRPRPSSDLINVLEVNTSGSFPSGHVMAAFFFFGTLCYIFYKLTKNKFFTVIISIISSIIVLCVAFSRIYVGAHWLSDCIGGIMTGISLLLPFMYLADWYLKLSDKILSKFNKKK